MSRKDSKEAMILNRLKMIGIIITITTAVLFPCIKYAEGCIDKKISKVVKIELSRELRDVRVLVEYNRMQAEKDSTKLIEWNKAIDMIDNGGKVR